MRELIERLAAYPDRPLVDYWRRVQGANVGFHGKEGSGVPIAGPAALISGSSSDSPFRDVYLKKYGPRSFIGGALRKPNFPVSAIAFIEGFVGKTDKAIKARIKATSEAYEKEKNNKMFSTGGSPAKPGRSESEYVHGESLKAAIMVGIDEQDRKFAFKALEAFGSHFESPGKYGAQSIQLMMKKSGVVGTFAPGDRAKDDDFVPYYQPVGEFGAEIPEHVLKAVIGNVYALNQALTKTKTVRCVRGVGDSIPGLTAYESRKVLKEMQDNDVSCKWLQRPFSGYSDGKDHVFGGFVISCEVPREAVLSSFHGARVQRSSFANERENLIIGGSEISFRARDVFDTRK